MKRRLAWLMLATAMLVILGSIIRPDRSPEPRQALAAPQASIWVDGRTGIQIQNVTGADATITARFYDLAGNLARTLPYPGVRPGAAINFYLPAIPDLASGAYAMIIGADREIAAINRTDNPISGAAVMYSNVARTTRTALPLVMKGAAGQTSLVAVQNTDVGAASDVQVDLYSWDGAVQGGGTQPIRSLHITLGPAASASIDLASTSPFADVPMGFRGWMLLTSSRPVGVQVATQYAGSDRTASAAEGLPVDEAASTAFVPLVRNSFYGTTAVAVLNPDLSAPVSVQATFHGSLGSCAGQTLQQGPAQVAPGASVLFYQGAVAMPVTGLGPLPSGCAGSAVLSVVGTGHILATVNDVNAALPAGRVTAAMYNAAGRGATKVALPLVRNHHTFADLVTGIQVMNVDADRAAHVRLSIYDSAGQPLAPGADWQASVNPSAAQTWYLPILSTIKDRRDFYGSAIVESDVPIMVTATDMSLAGVSDVVTYNGIPVHNGTTNELKVLAVQPSPRNHETEAPR